MARSPAQQLSTAPGSGIAELERLAKSALTPERVRDQVAAVKARTRQNFEEYLRHVNKIIEDLAGLLEKFPDSPIDVSQLIDSFLTSEREADGKRIEAEKTITDLLKLVSKRQPDLIGAFNEALAAQLDDINRMAEAHRDARWHLMKVRAIYQPSKGVGPIKGSHSDIEDLLNS